MRAIIVTVGTSLAAAKRRVMPEDESDLLVYLAANFPGASAETNSLERMQLAENDYLYFVSSGDEECHQCLYVDHTVLDPMNRGLKPWHAETEISSSFDSCNA